MTQIHFISFGAARYYNAVFRICNEAKQIELFNQIQGYTESDLWSTEFIKHKNFVQKNHGYNWRSIPVF
jgi:hypothetical protein